MKLFLSRQGGLEGVPGAKISPSAGAAGAPSQGEGRFTGLAIRRILVPLDGDPLAECALPFAVAVARAFAARVTLLRVLESARAGDEATHLDTLEWEMRRDEAHARLAGVQARLRAVDVDADVELIQGRAAERILEFADAYEADLLVLSSHGEGGASGWHLGSTTERLIARARTSVLIVPAAFHRATSLDFKIRRVLLPLDCSQRAECVLSPAIDLARVSGADLILAHVVLEPDLPRRLAPSIDDLRLVEQLTERNRVAAARYLRDLAARLTPHWKHIRTHLCVAPERSRALRKLAADENVDLVVLAAHGSTAEIDRSYGGLSARFLHETERPVLILQDFADAMREQSEHAH